MNKLFLFLTALMLFVLPSCSTFINLGDSEKSGTNGEDYLPEELSDEEQKESVIAQKVCYTFFYSLEFYFP